MRSGDRGMSIVEMPVEKTMPPPEAGRDVGEHYELIIESGRAERHYWLDLWRYRELFQVLAWRAIAASVGIGVWITALNVKYRDFRYVIPFMVQMGLYVSPVGFSSNVIPDQWRLLYSVNPMVGVIDGFRWCLLGGESRLYWPGLALSLVVAVFFAWFGIRQFRKMEKSFAD